jgi:hypothetical protein
MHEEERKELSHDPVPGYKTVFLIAFLIGVIYLAGILFNIF